MELTAINSVPSRRDKIGRHLSYPLKFSELSALFSEVKISFNAYKAPLQNELRPKFRVFEMSYEPEDSSYGITVSAVPRSLRARIHSLLVLELERVRDWLAAPRTLNWRSTYHALRLDFDSSIEGITRYEHNAV